MFLLKLERFLEFADIVLLVLSGLYKIVLLRWEGAVYIFSLNYLKSSLSAFL